MEKLSLGKYRSIDELTADCLLEWLRDEMLKDNLIDEKKEKPKK